MIALMKTLLITGGTGGLGHAVVARLARDYRVSGQLITFSASS
jgi:NAD(P)-dependent dehydrogenase (short-subunit alcohol dehydrogenase family)